MDKWKDLELEKMKSGGNKKFKEFLETQSDINSQTSFQQKYNSRAAALYKDKISTEAAGNPWSEATSIAANYKPPSSNSYSSMSNNNSKSSTYHDDSSFNSYQTSGNGIDVNNKDHLKKETNNFFNKRQAENMSRPENLPPSQGGRYAGFGNTVEPAKNDPNDFFNQFSSGFSSLTLNAGKFASVAKDNIVKISSTAATQANELTKTVNEKVKEGTLIESLGSGATNVGSKLGNAWSNLNSYWTGTEQFPQLKNSSSSSSFGKDGYDSVPGDSNSYQNGGMQGNYNNSLFSEDSNSLETNNKRSQHSQNKQKNTQDDWDGDWQELSWENTKTNSYQSSNTMSSNNNSNNNRKSASKPKVKKDLMNFEGDDWEDFEPTKKD